jgi:hypothetical protein
MQIRAGSLRNRCFCTCWAEQLRQFRYDQGHCWKITMPPNWLSTAPENFPMSTEYCCWFCLDFPLLHSLVPFAQIAGLGNPEMKAMCRSSCSGAAPRKCQSEAPCLPARRPAALGLLGLISYLIMARANWGRLWWFPVPAYNGWLVVQSISQLSGLCAFFQKKLPNCGVAAFKYSMGWRHEQRNPNYHTCWQRVAAY